MSSNKPKPRLLATSGELDKIGPQIDQLIDNPATPLWRAVVQPGQGISVRGMDLQTALPSGDETVKPVDSFGTIFAVFSVGGSPAGDEQPKQIQSPPIHLFNANTISGLAASVFATQLIVDESRTAQTIPQITLDDGTVVDAIPRHLQTIGERIDEIPSEVVIVDDGFMKKHTPDYLAEAVPMDDEPTQVLISVDTSDAKLRTYIHPPESELSSGEHIIARLSSGPLVVRTNGVVDYARTDWALSVPESNVQEFFGVVVHTSGATEDDQVLKQDDITSGFAETFGDYEGPSAVVRRLREA